MGNAHSPSARALLSQRARCRPRGGAARARPLSGGASSGLRGRAGPCGRLKAAAPPRPPAWPAAGCARSGPASGGERAARPEPGGGGRAPGGLRGVGAGPGGSQRAGAQRAERARGAGCGQSRRPGRLRRAPERNGGSWPPEERPEAWVSAVPLFNAFLLSVVVLMHVKPPGSGCGGVEKQAPCLVRLCLLIFSACSALPCSAHLMPLQVITLEPVCALSPLPRTHLYTPVFVRVGRSTASTRYFCAGKSSMDKRDRAGRGVLLPLEDCLWRAAERLAK